MATKKRKGYFGGKQSATISYKWNGTDSAGVANSTVASHGTGVKLPSGAIISNAWYNVNTTFTSATDSATIAITSGEGAGDMVVGIAISDATNVWDAGKHGTLLTAPNLGADAAHDSALETIALFAALPITLTAEREIAFVVGVTALTAGELTLYLEYWLP